MTVIPPYPPPPLSVVDRVYVSRWAIESLALKIMKLGVPGDADANNVLTAMATSAGTPVFAGRVADRLDVGVYSIELSSLDTSEPGFYDVTWSYTLDGVPQTYVSFIEVGETAPEYDALDEAMKDVIELTWHRFADEFDSVEGGPNVQDYMQTHFGRNRMAQLARLAVNTINITGQPMLAYNLVDPGRYPVEAAGYGGVLELMLYIETIKHLMRSYVEQPAPEGINHARLDRRDYLERWASLLEIEQANAKTALETLKIGLMFSGGPVVLVSGGAYGRLGYNRLPLQAAARGARFWTSWQ